MIYSVESVVTNVTRRWYQYMFSKQSFKFTVYLIRPDNKLSDDMGRGIIAHYGKSVHLHFGWMFDKILTGCLATFTVTIHSQTFSAFGLSSIVSFRGASRLILQLWTEPGCYGFILTLQTWEWYKTSHLTTKMFFFFKRFKNGTCTSIHSPSIYMKVFVSELAFNWLIMN